MLSMRMFFIECFEWSFHILPSADKARRQNGPQRRILGLTIPYSFSIFECNWVEMITDKLLLLWVGGLALCYGLGTYCRPILCYRHSALTCLKKVNDGSFDFGVCVLKVWYFNEGWSPWSNLFGEHAVLIYFGFVSVFISLFHHLFSSGNSLLSLCSFYVRRFQLSLRQILSGKGYITMVCCPSQLCLFNSECLCQDYHWVLNLSIIVLTVVELHDFSAPN